MKLGLAQRMQGAFGCFWLSQHNILSEVQALEARGFFSDEDDTGMQTPIKDKTQLGALKRAALRLGRTRLDIIYSLPEDKVAALADAPVPYPDRKARPWTSNTDMFD